MNHAVNEMLQKYQIQNSTDAENALKEVIQEIALLGLHRANFFEKAAFYGGTALRILYGLPRYSEDLDFTLFRRDLDFRLQPYFSAMSKEFEAYGFKVEIELVDKNFPSNVESAFIKANSKIHLLKIESLNGFGSKIQANAKLQIKFEVDLVPVINFNFETRYLLAPTSFPIISLQKPDLFAGKLHAFLFRKWKTRIKGRDFYDYVWYLKNNTPVRLAYLREKSIQSGHLHSEEELQTTDQLKKMITERINSVNIEMAKQDVLPFIKNPKELDIWSKDFFIQITENIRTV